MQLMKYSMMLGFQLFTSLNPVAHCVASPGYQHHPHWSLDLIRGKRAPGSHFQLEPKLAGQRSFPCTSLPSVKREILKYGAAICTTAWNLKWAFHRGGGQSFSSYSPKHSESRTAACWPFVPLGGFFFGGWRSEWEIERYLSVKIRLHKTDINHGRNLIKTRNRHRFYQCWKPASEPKSVFSGACSRMRCLLDLRTGSCTQKENIVKHKLYIDVQTHTCSTQFQQHNTHCFSHTVNLLEYSQVLSAILTDATSAGIRSHQKLNALTKSGWGRFYHPYYYCRFNAWKSKQNTGV